MLITLSYNVFKNTINKQIKKKQKKKIEEKKYVEI